VRVLRGARSRAGVGFDAIPSLAVHLQGAPPALALPAIDPWPAGLDPRWQSVDLPRFVSAANRAARAAGFERLWADLAPLRVELTAWARAAADALDLAWFESWFGMPAPGAATVFASPLAGVYNYGPRVVGRAPALFAILGVSREADGDGLSAPEPSLLVHEVGHSFVNPVLTENVRFVAAPGARLFSAVEGRMRALHYGTWETTVAESVLRAVVVRYLLAHAGEAAARRETARQLTEGFPWTLVLADTLAAYEADRARYPTFGDFAPTLAATLDVIAAEETSRAAGRPRVVTISPDLSRPVDPASPALVVIFSRPMRRHGWSIVGAREDIPESGEPRFDETGTVFSLPWRLQAGRTYRFSLNSLRFQGFQSEAGVPLEPVPVAIEVGG
jgi:hypothetical protein